MDRDGQSIMIVYSHNSKKTRIFAIQLKINIYIYEY